MFPISRKASSVHSIGSSLGLGLLQLWNVFWTFGIYLLEVALFYKIAPLRYMDLTLMRLYGLSNPFRLSAVATRKHFSEAEDLTVYGETPWTTLKKICDAVELSPQDVFVDLGAGTGRNLCFVHHYYGVRAVGYELIPDFVTRFQQLLAIAHKKNWVISGALTMKEANWFDVTLTGDVFLLVGTCYDDTSRKQAAEVLKHLPQGKKVVTISYALPEQCFLLLSSFTHAFSWGRGTVFIQQRI